MPLPSAIASASSGHATTTAPAAAVAEGLHHAPHQQDVRDGGIKGNSGAGQRRRGRNRYYACVKCVVWTGLVLGAYQTLWTYWLAGVNVPDREVDAVTGRERIRRRPDLLVKHDPVKGISVPTSPVDGILEGYLTLIRIDLPPGGGLVPGRARKSSAGGGGGEDPTNTNTIVAQQQQAPPAYTGVQGVFCHVSWKLQKDSPAAYPFFLDLQKSSTMCPSTTVTVDLWQVTQQAREYDARHNHTLAANQPSQSGNKKKTKFKFGSQLPRAVIFHESKCGSTVVSNVLQAYQTKMTRVYSEPPAPLQAIMACHRKKRLQQDPRQPPIICDENAHEQLIRDVFYIMGRTDKLHVKHQHVFYKISSMSTLALDAFVRAMPNTPWAFVYRDPVEVLMSHFPHYQKQQKQENAGVDSVALLGKDHRNQQQATCLRTYKAPNQPAILERVVDAAQHKAVEDLDPVEYCAAYLAALCQAALEEYHRTGNERGVKHFFMDHQELPYAIWETMLPALMGPLKHEDIDTLHAVAKVYSHTGTRTNNNKKSNSILDGITSSSTSTSSTQQQQQKQRWKEDSTLKQGKAPAVIKRAAETFMYPVYKQLNKVRKELEERYRHGGQ